MKHISWFDFRSIKQKILFFGGFALLLVAACIIGYAAFALNSEAMNAAHDEMNSIAEREAAYIGKVLEEPYFYCLKYCIRSCRDTGEELSFCQDRCDLLIGGHIKGSPAL